MSVPRSARVYVCVVGAFLAHAQSPVLPPVPSGLEIYRKAIADFRDGEERPVRLVASASRADVSRWVALSVAELRPIDLKAATVLHTDAAIDRLRAGNETELSAMHLGAAEQLIEAVLVAQPADRWFARRWHVVVEGYLRAVEHFREADRFAERARRRLGSDAAWRRFLLGLHHELAAATAGPVSASAVAAHRWGLDPIARSELMSAAREFAHAMAIDPTLLDAALHLGRVYIVLDAPKQAVAPLERAARSSDPGVACLARLFLGAVFEHLGRQHEAEGQYRAAVAAFRWGQSAPLALSQLQARTGRAAEARETLRLHFQATAGRLFDPIWTYLALPSEQLGPSLDALRADIWR